MGPLTSLLVAYLVGGVTFIPLLILAVLVHAHRTFPHRHDAVLDHDKSQPFEATSDIVQPGDDTEALDEAKAEELRNGRINQPLDVAAGYFAVYREYTPIGINAKPVEKSTPAGAGSAMVAPPSPSVYQTMYRSIFDRKAANGPIENHSMSQRPKRAGNIFYIVLRHGHLMLFDDEEQLEVRHVISLAHYDIGIYSGGDVTPEGELFIKKNALCLSRRVSTSDKAVDGQASKPFYLFSENCSAKEDFYFALLKNQEQTFTFPDRAPMPKTFDIKNIITLVQKLHSSEDNIHSRWVNAMLGRIFLGVHQTKDIESFIREKIEKKISRVKKPSYLTNIHIRRIDTGEAAPYFSNLKLKDLTVEGECVVEADVRYTGNFRIEVATTAKIDLGTRFKAREVDLVLAVMLKRIEGHVLFKIKPPPSNRLWFSFQTMPKMEMTIEPIVSARQITYTVILRQIENRIKEVMAETLVQPFWDDSPFFRTEHKKWRGGIFENDDAVDSPEASAEPESIKTDVPNLDGKEDLPDTANTRPLDKSQTMPIIEEQPAPTGLFGRRLNNKTSNSPVASVSSVNLDSKGSAATTSRSPGIIKNSDPVVSTEAAHADLFKPSSSPPDQASNFMAAIHSRAQDMSPLPTPVGSPEKPGLAHMGNLSSGSSQDGAEGENEETAPSRRNTASSIGSNSVEGPTPPSPSLSAMSSLQSQAESIGRKFFTKRDSNASVATNSTSSSGENPMQKRNTLAAVTNAANQARQWGWNAIQKQKEARRVGESNSQVDLSQPMGRGQPLPPPGMPLPGPTNGKTKLNPLVAPKRKPVPNSVPEQTAEQELKEPERDSRQTHNHNSLPRGRRRRASYDQEEPEEQPMLVIGIPDISEPTTPAAEERPDILGGGDEQTIEEPHPQVDDSSPTDIEAEPTHGLSTHELDDIIETSTENTATSTVPDTTSSEHDEESTPIPSAETQSPETSPPTEEELGVDEPMVAMPPADSTEAEADVHADAAEDDFSPWLEDDVDNNLDENTLQEVLPTAIAGKVNS